MQLRSLLASLILAALLAGSLAYADDDTTLVPMDTVEAPASDLIYQGKAIDQDQAVSLKKSGVDLSLLEPSANDSWGNPLHSPPMPLPADGATVNFDSSLAGFGHELSIHRVVLGAKAYHLDVSTIPHRALLTRALLSRLGYNQYQLKRYNTLTVKFASLDDRKNFLDAIALDTIKDPATWVKSMPDNKPILTLQDVVLEPGRVDLQNFYWGTLPSQFSQGRRALRALLVPLSLSDAPENIDSFHWDFDRVLNNSLLVAYPHEIESQRPFDDSTIDDMRWIAHKIAALTVADWKAIVLAANYPTDIADIVLQKIIAKRNQMLTSMNISAAALPYDVHLSNNSVTNGQVMVATFPGYTSRFTYGDADDPLNTHEMVNLGIMTSITSAMDTLAGQLSQKLVVQGIDSFAKAHQAQLLNEFIQHIQQHPDQPYTQPISTWGGPVGSFNVNASRAVTTGSFYGSNAAIQLVDTIGITGTAGYFRGIDGIKNAIPALQANISVGRNYTHLRTLTSIDDALQVPALDFIIPNLLNDLSVLLAAPAKAPKDGQTAALKTYSQAVEDLLSNIRDGEMFTITDTAAGALGAKVIVPIQALFPAAPVGYNENISFGAQVSGVVLRRTTFSRVHDETSGDNYLQIYVQSLDTATGSLTLDFNYWLNIAHFQTDLSKGYARSRVYTIQDDPNRAEDASRTLAVSIQSLLSSNSDSGLEKNYPFYLLQHDLDESDVESRFLFFQAKHLEERHNLRIEPPTDSKHQFNPKDFERTLFSYRRLNLTGFNFMAVIGDIVNALTQGQGRLSTGAGDNPANTILGSAHWTELYSDGELTAKSDFAPVTTSKEVWAGWSISHDSLYKIFDTIDSELSNLRAFGINVSPIHRDIFAATDKLEFYNVSASTIFYANGVNRILSAIFPPDDPNYKPDSSEARSRDSFSASDVPVFLQLVAWLGGGDKYMELCSSNSDGTQSANLDYEYKGNTYQCMETWANSVLDLRRQRPADSDRQNLIEWQTKMLELLEQKVPLLQLLNLAQKDGFFLRVTVSGFRKGDHEAKDSEKQEVIASYVSDSVGTADQYAGSGAFSALTNQTKIMPFEVNGLFFSGGD